MQIWYRAGLWCHVDTKENTDEATEDERRMLDPLSLAYSRHSQFLLLPSAAFTDRTEACDEQHAWDRPGVVLLVVRGTWERHDAAQDNRHCVGLHLQLCHTVPLHPGAHTQVRGLTNIILFILFLSFYVGEGLVFV